MQRSRAVTDCDRAGGEPFRVAVACASVVAVACLAGCDRRGCMRGRRCGSDVPAIHFSCGFGPTHRHKRPAHGSTDLVRAARPRFPVGNAVHVAAATRPDVLLLDLYMPELDGHGVLTALRGAEHQPTVVVLTSATEDEDLVRAM